MPIPAETATDRLPASDTTALGAGSGRVERRRNGAGGVREVDRTRTVVLLKSGGVLAIIMVVAAGIYALARSGLYTSGSDTGYYLGLAGALMMLALLLYPLRKRVKWLSGLGRISGWFSVHMMLGVLGPVLILLHCTLRWSSLNAAVAFWCMVVVASSGVVGRFLYSRLHVGLYGRQLTLTEVRVEAASLLKKTRELLQADQVEDIPLLVQEFGRKASDAGNAGWRHPLALMALGLRGRLAQRRCLRLARTAAAAGRPLPSRDSVDSALGYIVAAQRSAQFLPFERLFALWHVLHVPLVVILVLTVIAHIIAVHMY